MMVTFSEMKVQAIVDDDSLGTEAKIEKLREIEREARDLQRVASEGPMNPNDGWDEDLRSVRKALKKLGAEEIPKGAASL